MAVSCPECIQKAALFVFCQVWSEGNKTDNSKWIGSTVDDNLEDLKPTHLNILKFSPTKGVDNTCFLFLGWVPKGAVQKYIATQYMATLSTVSAVFLPLHSANGVISLNIRGSAIDKCLMLLWISCFLLSSFVKMTSSLICTMVFIEYLLLWELNS